MQPGPDGEMEYNYLGMKKIPGNVGAMKRAMTGQPVPDDPTWGTSDGVMGGPSGGGTFNPQPVTTQHPAAAEENQ